MSFYFIAKVDNGLSMDELASGLNAQLDQVKRDSISQLVQKGLITNQMERIFNNVQINWSALVLQAILTKISDLETEIKNLQVSIRGNCIHIHLALS